MEINAYCEGKNMFKTFIKNEKGVVAVVFALVAPMLAVTFYLGYDSVTAISYQSRLDDASREANMAISLEGHISEVKVKSYIKTYMDTGRFATQNIKQEYKRDLRTNQVSVFGSVSPMFASLATTFVVKDTDGIVKKTKDVSLSALSNVVPDPYKYAGNSDYVFAIDFSKSMVTKKADDIFTKKELSELCEKPSENFSEGLCNISNVTKLKVAQEAIKHILKILALKKDDSVSYSIVPFSVGSQVEQTEKNSISYNPRNRGDYIFVTPFVFKSDYKLKTMKDYDKYTYLVKSIYISTVKDRYVPNFSADDKGDKGCTQYMKKAQLKEKPTDIARKTMNECPITFEDKGKSDENYTKMHNLLALAYEPYMGVSPKEKDDYYGMKNYHLYKERMDKLLASIHSGFSYFLIKHNILNKTIDVDATIENVFLPGALDNTFGFRFCSYSDRSFCNTKEGATGTVWNPNGFPSLGTPVSGMGARYAIADGMDSSETALKNLKKINKMNEDPVTNFSDKKTLKSTKTDDYKIRVSGLLRGASYLKEGTHQRKVLVLITDDAGFKTDDKENMGPALLDLEFINNGLCTTLENGLKTSGAQTVDIIVMVIGKKVDNVAMSSVIKSCGAKHVIFAENIKEFVDGLVDKTLQKEKLRFKYKGI